MTKEEFINYYVEGSGIIQYKTEYGFNIDGRKRFAVPCNCGEGICQGWKMLSEEFLAEETLKENDDGRGQT
jgi:hypothetical protein